MKKERVTCKACGKSVFPSYQPAEMSFFCPKCKEKIPVTKKCSRRIQGARLIFHFLAFGLILLVFGLLMGNDHAVLAVIFAVIGVPAANALEKPLMDRIFFRSGKYQFEQ